MLGFGVAPPRSGPGRRDGDQRRDAILDAALACFVERGMLATGIEDIRKAAHASPSSIYHQFTGIADIVLALVERIAASHYTALADAAAGATSLEHAVRESVAALLAWTFAHPDEARFMYQAFAMELAGAERRKLEAVKHAQRNGFEQAVQAWLEDGPLAAWSSLELSTLMLGATHQACRIYLTGQHLDPAWMVETLPTLAWLGVDGMIEQARRLRRRPRAPRSR